MPWGNQASQRLLGGLILRKGRQLLYCYHLTATHLIQMVYTAVLLLLNTGMWLSKVFGLKWPDIDFTVRESMFIGH